MFLLRGGGMKKLISAVAVLAVALVAVGVSMAHHNYSGVAGSVVDVADGPGGNTYCPAGTNKGPKIDPGSNYSDAYVVIDGYDGKKFNWHFTALGNDTYDMAAVIVKGGPISAVYTYDYTGNPAFDDADTGLAAPNNPNGGGQPKDYGISHIQFCYDPKGGGDN